MTPKIIELKQAAVVLAELPKGCKHENLLGKSGDGTFLLWDSTNNSDDDNRPHGQILIDAAPFNKWRILGIISDLTEEQFAECVDEPFKEPPFRPIGSVLTYPGGESWCDYTKGGCWMADITTAEESFYTLLESENVYTENPYRRKPEPCGCTGPCGIPCAFNEWQEAQSRTINPERTVVLVKKEEQDE